MNEHYDERARWREMEEEEALESDEWLEERARVYENLAADYEKAAAIGRAPPNERTYEQLGIIMPRPTPGERAARIPYYLEQATKWHAEAAKWRARAAERRASLQRRLAQVPKTAEERAAIEAQMAEMQREALLEIRRHTRHGKPDARFTHDGVSEVQKITGKEKVWRLYVRPGVSTSTTFGKANPYWLKASEPGALVYDVWARSEKQAKLLVKQQVRAQGPHLPGIRRQSTVPGGSDKKRRKD